MRVKGIAWLGVRTERYDAMTRFYRDVFGLEPRFEIPGQFAVFDLPGGDRAEVFALTAPFNQHFPAGPVAGFLVDDVAAARAEMEAAGIEFVHHGESEAGLVAWAHFRAPDGNLYEITHRKDLDAD
jgi:catechol 2,3-dioxygenase-like lactoylglutathione lyase family enzyme